MRDTKDRARDRIRRGGLRPSVPARPHKFRHARFLVARPSDDRKFTPEKSVNECINNYRKVQKDFPQPRCSLSKTVKVPRTTPPVISLAFRSGPAREARMGTYNAIS